MDRDATTSILRELHRAQNRFYRGGDVSALMDILTTDVVWTVPGNNDIAGTYHGVQRVREYFLRRRAIANESFQLNPRELLVGEGAYVASITDGRATINGVQHQWSTVGLYRIDESRVGACWLLPLDAAQFDAVWTSRQRSGS